MKANRIVKWAAAGALTLGVIPAIGMAHSRASLPTSNVTVTPTSLEAPLASKPHSKITQSKAARVTKASAHSHKTRHHKKTTTATRHKSTTATHHTTNASHHSKTASHHKKTSTNSKHKLTFSKSHKTTAGAKKSSHSTIN